MSFRKPDELIKESQLAKQALLKHGVVAFPTETVMGLACVFDDYDAYSKLNQIKRRPEDKPYTLMLKNKHEINKYAVISSSIQRVIDAFVPGSITLLVPLKVGSVPEFVTHGMPILGVRVPENEESLAVLNAIDKPLLVPSANRSGEAPALTSEEVLKIFGDEVDFVVSGEAKKSRPSTIVDLTKPTLKVVREGPISEAEILEVWKKR